MTTLEVTAGLAEIAAGSSSMGLGGYLAGCSDRAENYEADSKSLSSAIRTTVIGGIAAAVAFAIAKLIA